MGVLGTLLRTKKSSIKSDGTYKERYSMFYSKKGTRGENLHNPTCILPESV